MAHDVKILSDKEWWVCDHPERPFDEHSHFRVHDCHGCLVYVQAVVARGDQLEEDIVINLYASDGRITDSFSNFQELLDWALAKREE